MNDQLDVLREVVAGLEQGGIAYMVSGSTALNYYAEPRMTRDIDIVIELGPHETARFEQIFRDDFYLDKAVIEQAVRDRGMFNLIHLGRVVKVDFIVRKDSEYRRLEFSRRRRVEAVGLTLHLVSAEDLILSNEAGTPAAPREGHRMTDTPPDVAHLYHEMLMARSGSARLRMGCDLFMAARRLALAGLQAESPGDLSARLFLRFYGRDFSPHQRAVIAERIRARSDERSRSSSAR